MTDLEGLKALLDAATPGPWYTAVSRPQYGDPEPYLIETATRANLLDHRRENAADDFALIVALHSAAPALLSELASARRVVEAAREYLAVRADEHFAYCRAAQSPPMGDCNCARGAKRAVLDRALADAERGGMA